MVDLETTAHRGFFWGRSFETNIIRTTEYGKILSYAANWLGEKIIVRGWDDFKKDKERSLVKELRELFDKADYICGHNLKSFDNKWVNSRMLYYGLPIPSPYKVLDTKIIAKRYLNIPSYKLNDIAHYFGLGKKLDHEGFILWEKCIAGNKKAWRRMKSYNKIDNELLEKVYLKLRKFDPKLP